MINKMNNIRIAFFGPSASGKSSLARCLAGERFDRSYFSTIGVDAKHRSMHDKNIKLMVWDLAGDPKFSSIISSYMVMTKIIFLCYDSSNYTSYQRLCESYTRIKHLLKDKVLCVVALKYDLYNSGFKDYEWGRDLATRIGCPFLTSSAKTNNINDILQWVYDYDKTIRYDLELGVVNETTDFKRDICPCKIC